MMYTILSCFEQYIEQQEWLEDNLTWVPRTEVKVKKLGPRDIGRIDYNPDLERKRRSKKKHKSGRGSKKSQRKSRVWLPEKFKRDSSIKSTLPQIKVHKAGPREIGTIDYDPPPTKSPTTKRGKKKKKGGSSPNSKKPRGLPHRISLPPMRTDKITKKIMLTPRSEFIAENDAYSPNSGGHSVQTSSSSVSTQSRVDTPQSRAETDPIGSPFANMFIDGTGMIQPTQETIDEDATLGITLTSLNNASALAAAAANNNSNSNSNNSMPSNGSLRLRQSQGTDEFCVMGIVEDEEDDDKSVEFNNNDVDRNNIIHNEFILSDHKSKTVPVFEDNEQAGDDAQRPFIVDIIPQSKGVTVTETQLQNTLSGGSIGALFMSDSVILEDSDMDEVESINGGNRSVTMPHMITQSHSYELSSPKKAKIMNFAVDDSNDQNNDDKLIDIIYDDRTIKKKSSQRSTSLFTISTSAKQKLKEKKYAKTKAKENMITNINTTTPGYNNETPISPDTPINGGNEHISRPKSTKKRKNKIWTGNQRNPTL